MFLFISVHPNRLALILIRMTISVHFLPYDKTVVDNNNSFISSSEIA